MTRTVRGRSSALLAVALLFAAGPLLRAEAPASAKADVEYDHLEGTSRIFMLEVSDKHGFVVRIKNTCPDAFDYKSTGVEKAPPREPRPEGLAPLSTKDIEIVHDDRFGGYVINITPKPGEDGDAARTCVGGARLRSASFIISVREPDFGISFSGGFTFSGLTNPVFAIKTENGIKTVVEEQDKEDDYRLGAASFVHVYHDNFRPFGRLQPALALGIGINGDSHAEYLVGAALRLGDQATVNVGMAWGSVQRLPNGLAVNDPVTNDNVLNNLGTRVVSRWFFALSYTFIDAKSRLLKPFADPGGAGTAPRPAASPSPSPSPTPPAG